MIDHILAFQTEATARQALPTFCSQDQDGNWRWDGSRVIAPISIITAEAVWSGEGMDRELVTPEQTLPGFWLAIALPETDTDRRAALVAMDECSLVADRDAANRGEQFIIYMGAEVDPMTVATARAAPVFAGSRYPFGG